MLIFFHRVAIKLFIFLPYRSHSLSLSLPLSRDSRKYFGKTHTLNPGHPNKTDSPSVIHILMSICKNFLESIAITAQRSLCVCLAQKEKPQSVVFSRAAELIVTFPPHSPLNQLEEPRIYSSPHHSLQFTHYFAQILSHFLSLSLP